MQQLDRKTIEQLANEFCKTSQVYVDENLKLYSYGTIYLQKPIKELPFEFSFVEGDFICSDCELESFKGFPKIIGGSLIARSNKFTNFDYFPLSIDGDIDLYNNQLTHLYNLPKHHKYSLNLNANQLTSLEGMPETIGGTLKIMSNFLTNLKGSLKEVKNLECCYNEITTLENMPCVKNTFDCSKNKLTNLKGISQEIIKLNANDNQLTEFTELSTSLNEISCSNNPLTTLSELNGSHIKLISSYNNQITNINDLNMNLVYLDISKNPIKNVKTCTKVEKLIMENIPLTTIDAKDLMWVSHNIKLSHIKSILNIQSLKMPSIEMINTQLTEQLIEQLLLYFDNNQYVDITSEIVIDQRNQQCIRYNEKTLFLTKNNIKDNPTIKAYIEKKQLESSLSNEIEKKNLKKI
jgi:hypothetical protein